MDMPISERRQIENEMIFRRLNEVVEDNIEKLDTMHIEDDNPQLIWDDAILLNFMCECSDENCDKRIPIKLSAYKRIHENRDAFIIKLKHQVEDIEKVILSEDNYSVVQKNKSTAEPNDNLKNTSIDNS
jgi:hypothetical protein